MKFQKFTPYLWFEYPRAKEAVEFYCSVFENSKIFSSDETVIEFELDGTNFAAFQAAGDFPAEKVPKFSEAISLMVSCNDQDETDSLWSRLVAEGGKEQPCGWCRDKFGVSWQVVPKRFVEMMKTGTPDQTKRVVAAMMKMKKVVIADLEQAFTNGESDTNKMKHTITKETIEPFVCMGLPHKGPYKLIGNKFKEMFGALHGGDGTGCEAHAHTNGKALGLYLDNPDCTAEEDLRSYAAVKVTDPDGTWPEGFTKVEVSGGKVAVMTILGGYEQLASAWESFGPRIMEQGWKFAVGENRIAHEIYEVMDMQDPTKNVTKLVMFLGDEN